jgi:hypothetical protein
VGDEVLAVELRLARRALDPQPDRAGVVLAARRSLASEPSLQGHPSSSGGPPSGPSSMLPPRSRGALAPSYHGRHGTRQGRPGHTSRPGVRSCGRPVLRAGRLRRRVRGPRRRPRGPHRRRDRGARWPGHPHPGGPHRRARRPGGLRQGLGDLRQPVGRRPRHLLRQRHPVPPPRRGRTRRALRGDPQEQRPRPARRAALRAGRLGGARRAAAPRRSPPPGGGGGRARPPRGRLPRPDPDDRGGRRPRRVRRARARPPRQRPRPLAAPVRPAPRRPAGPRGPRPRRSSRRRAARRRTARRPAAAAPRGRGPPPRGPGRPRRHPAPGRR